MGPGDKDNEQQPTTDESSDSEPVHDVPAPRPEYVENGYKPRYERKIIETD